MARGTQSGLNRAGGGGRFGETLASWMEAEGFAAPAGDNAIGDVERVRTILLRAAREARAVSYSELLSELGHRFSRPKMRALCKTLDAIDAVGAARGEPELAALVVREADRLPGQGWWVSHAKASGFAGSWTGPAAAAFVQAVQQQAFDFWGPKLQP